ncbi:hypothetical protein E4582_07675 [Luteimonas yindakuii]|uniref:DUF3379 domain-containing protein n=1 Tax=Luteimonas yindakuii TaxID=2565782 RepID=A0A4Z1R6U0_9GAMM|nr:hypothetical protein [Luteimonas yindakuii]QCO68256.1 hypothetical protein E5843_11670 [Luteimonas yindakuii]TKS54646.1 hypothetical protein E4582_07675 [Luteimonas yindakuii]
MTAPHGPQDRFDHAARRLHDDALRQITPRTLARLRPRSPAAPATALPSRRPAFALAAACVLALAALLGMQLLPEADSPAPANATMVARQLPAPPQVSDPLATLEEDPDMFLWLASIEAQPVAME